MDEEKACSNKAYHNAKKILEIDKRLSKEMNIVLELKDLKYFDIFYTYKLSKDLASLNNLRLIQKKISAKTSGKVSFRVILIQNSLVLFLTKKELLLKTMKRIRRN